MSKYLEESYEAALRENDALRQRLANTELELTHAAKTCAEQQWRAEQAQARLAAAEAALRKIADHAEESRRRLRFGQGKH